MVRHNPFVALGQLRPELMGVVFHLAWMFLLMYYDDAPTFKREIGSTNIDVFYAISFASLVFFSIIFIIWVKRFKNFFMNTTGAVVAGAITCLGTIAFCFSVASPTILMLSIAGVLTGLGSSVTAALWSAIFSKISPRQTCINLPVILAMVVFMCIDATFIPDTFFYILVVFLPLISSLCLVKSINNFAGTNYVDCENKSPQGANAIRPSIVMAILVIMLMIIGLLEGMLASMPDKPVFFTTSHECFFYFIMTAIIFIFLGIFTFESRRHDFFMLYLMPCIIIIAFLIPPICLDPQNASTAFYNIGLMSQELILIAGTAALALNFRLPAIRTFLVARIILGSTDMLGAFGGSIFISETINSMAGLIIFAAGEILIIILIGILWLVHQYNINHTDIKLPDEEMHNIQVKDICTQLAKTHHLSPRESDVFYLLAEGRSTSRIQETLFIAEGTVNTHVRNIYRKLDVHTKQELIDLVYKSSAGEDS